MGKVVGASKIARDISDRKRMEALLIQGEKLAATGRMAAAIAHEINNPLESLINLIFLARQESAVEGKAYRYLLTAEEELERVSTWPARRWATTGIQVPLPRFIFMFCSKTC